MSTRQTFEFVEPSRAIEPTPASAQMSIRGVPSISLRQRRGVINVDLRHRRDVSAIPKESSATARDITLLSGTVRRRHDGARP
jgi:hypothetical protein